MKLSVELFKSALEQLGGATGSEDWSEKRATPRIPIRCRAKLYPVQDKVLAAPLNVWTRDISQGGLGIICSTKMNAGEHYVLKLGEEDSTPSQPPTTLYCTVKYCQEMTSGVFSVGFAFEDLRPKAHGASPIEQKLPTHAIGSRPLQPEDEERIRKAILG